MPHRRRYLLVVQPADCAHRRPHAFHHSETVRFSGQIFASFHTACGDALLDACETRLASRAESHNGIQTAHDLLVEPAEAGGSVMEAFHVLGGALADQPHA